MKYLNNAIFVKEIIKTKIMIDQRIEKYLNTNIKEIISEFEEVQNVLDKYNIGCAPCSVGTCKLKDIIDIHNLNEMDEKQLLTESFEIIFPGEKLEIPRVATDKKPSGLALSPPLKELVEEHNLIKRLLALIPNVIAEIDVKKSDHKVMITNVTDFIKNYADKYHHAKEEDILFKYFDPSLDIIQVMLHDHVSGRSFVSAILKGLETENNEIVKENLNNYCTLLTEHIYKEDNILYPWMDKGMDMRTVGEMFTKFAEVSLSMKETRLKYEQMIVSFEEKFKK